MRDIIIFLLLIFLIVCAIAVSFSKNLLNSIIIFMSYSTVMAIIWVLLESPDLAITEAAVGAGITSVLFFVSLRKIQVLDDMIKQDKIKAIMAEQSLNLETEEKGGDNE
ncbi:MAG: DUF4040 domain-containing protein [Lachnospiraceae bacterium]|nr:DUF4040 domain-containing protein [Lachnospiraceae bacterium]